MRKSTVRRRVARRMRRCFGWAGLIAAGVLFQTAGCIQNPDLFGFQIANLLRTAFVRALGFALVNR